MCIANTPNFSAISITKSIPQQQIPQGRIEKAIRGIDLSSISSTELRNDTTLLINLEDPSQEAAVAKELKSQTFLANYTIDIETSQTIYHSMPRMPKD